MSLPAVSRVLAQKSAHLAFLSEFLPEGVKVMEAIYLFWGTMGVSTFVWHRKSWYMSLLVVALLLKSRWQGMWLSGSDCLAGVRPWVQTLVPPEQKHWWWYFTKGRKKISWYIFCAVTCLMWALENDNITPYKIPTTVTRPNEGLREPARIAPLQRKWRGGRRCFLYVAKEELDGVNPETVYF